MTSYTTKDGWLFEKEPGGSIRITTPAPTNTTSAHIAYSTVIDAGDWYNVALLGEDLLYRTATPGEPLYSIGAGADFGPNPVLGEAKED